MTADRLGALIMAVPAVLTAVAWLAMLAVTAVTGTHPIWSLSPRNLSEAAALRDIGGLVRLARDGQDINQPAEVRARLILDEAAMLTPLEAAAAARDEALAGLVIELGARPDAAVWNRAFCISDADSVRRVLQAHRPAGAVEDCASP